MRTGQQMLILGDLNAVTTAITYSVCLLCVFEAILPGSYPLTWKKTEVRR